VEVIGLDARARGICAQAPPARIADRGLSPIVGFARSISMSKGASPRIDSPAVVSSATLLRASGFDTGVQGMSSQAGASGIRPDSTFSRKPPAKRQGST
jgi:hypothetical protein